MVCIATEGWVILYALATSDCMTQERAGMIRREDLGWDFVDGIRAGCCMSTLPDPRQESRSYRLGSYPFAFARMWTWKLRPR